MILQALKEYYDRKAADLGSGIAPFGWEKRGIPFLVVITKSGAFVNVEDTRCIVEKKSIAKEFLVPKAVTKTSGINSNLLWENTEYALGEGNSESISEEEREAFSCKVMCRHQDFIKKLTGYENVEEVRAVLDFLSSENEKRKLFASDIWSEMVLSKANLSFKLVEEDVIVCQSRSFRALYEAQLMRAKVGSCCAVTGESTSIPKTHPEIVGVQGTKMGLKVNHGMLVSYNWKAAESYGQKQSVNSHVGEVAVFAYTTALNTLLARGSRQKLTVGDATVVFWSQRESVLENEMASFFDDYEEKDNPDAHTEKVAALLKSVESGAYLANADANRFYVLGLSPNSARISVRFWYDGTVAGMAEKIAAWFADLMIAHGSGKKDHLSMYRLLCSVAALGKSENVPPNLAGEVMRAILEGLPLPTSLLQAALRRIKDESGDVSYERAKIIKACLNRKIRFNQIKEKELTVMLDKENLNVGYCLGRLFAVLERAQEAANNYKELNSTIRDKYYASASSTPATVFGTLMRLKNHHLSKIMNTGSKVFFERLLGEIVDKIPRFPAHLKMDDQGQFAIGYYHQRQDLFPKKSEDNN